MTRVLTGEKRRVDEARRIARARFDHLLWHVPEDQRDAYWGRMSVPQEAFYAFEEVLSVFADEPGAPNTMLAAMEQLADTIERTEAAGASPDSPPLRLPRLDPPMRRRELAKFLRLEPDDQIKLMKPLRFKTRDGGESATPPESPVDAYSNWFYVSYAPTDGGAYLSAFFRDLSSRVAKLVGTGDAAGYLAPFDFRGTTGWTTHDALALAHTRTFVPILSPRYLASEFCGREWQAFRSRVPSGTTNSGIVPVIWEPLPDRLPAAVSEIQLTSSQVERGVLSLSRTGLLRLSRRSADRQDYELVVDALARQIVEVGKRGVVPPVDSLAPLESFSNALELPVAAQESVRVVCFAGPASDMRAVRKTVSAYGALGEDWIPYGGSSLRLLSSQTASEMRLLIQFIPANDSLLARPDSGITLVVIDAWSLRLPGRAEMLTKLDRTNLPDWAFLMVLDNQPDTEKEAGTLQQKAYDTFVRTRLRWVSTQDELNTAVREILESLRLRALSRATSTRPPSL
jgi:FxsC-like protein